VKDVIERGIDGVEKVFDTTKKDKLNLNEYQLME
jgi:hypothetical protein